MSADNLDARTVNDPSNTGPHDNTANVSVPSIDELVYRLLLLVQGKDLLNRPADFRDYWQGCLDAADVLERQQRDLKEAVELLRRTKDDDAPSRVYAKWVADRDAFLARVKP